MEDSILSIHIGMPKTGTTAIQDFCALNRRELGNQRLLYPALGKGHAHHGLMRLIYQAQPNDHRMRRFYNLRRKIEKSKCERVLVSSEFAARLKDVSELRRLLRGVHTRIIVYLRRQDNWLLSAYNQNVKSPATSLEDTFDEFTKRPHLERRLNYENLLDLWSDAFGFKNLDVYVYEEEKRNGQLIRRFLERLGVNMNSKKLRDAGNPNRALDRHSLEIVRICNSMNLDPTASTKITKMLIKNQGTTNRDPAIVSDLKRRAILDAYRESNSNVAKRYLGRTDGRLFDDSDLDVNSQESELEFEKGTKLLIKAILPLLEKAA